MSPGYQRMCSCHTIDSLLSFVRPGWGECLPAQEVYVEFPGLYEAEGRWESKRTPAQTSSLPVGSDLQGGVC